MSRSRSRACFDGELPSADCSIIQGFPLESLEGWHWEIGCLDQVLAASSAVTFAAFIVPVTGLASSDLGAHPATQRLAI
jgi:hypothetical protein